MKQSFLGYSSKFTLHGFLLILNTQLFAQDSFRCAQYKIQYNSDSVADSSRFRIGTAYYDRDMRLINTTVLGPAPQDSCQTHYWYDQFGHLTAQSSSCTDSKDVDSSHYQYEYGKEGKVIKETFRQDRPFYEHYIATFLKDSTVKIYYLDEEDARQGLVGRKEVEIHNARGQKIHLYILDEKGDTDVNESFAYFSLADRARIRADPYRYVSPALRPMLGSITYANDHHPEAVVDYYSAGQYAGTLTRSYTHNKMTLEQYYSRGKGRVTNETQYFYGVRDALQKKVKKDLIDGVTEISRYSEDGRIVREDYVYGATLDHSIVYQWEPER